MKQIRCRLVLACGGLGRIIQKGNYFILCLGLDGKLLFFLLFFLRIHGLWFFFFRLGFNGYGNNGSVKYVVHVLSTNMSE